MNPAAADLFPGSLVLSVLGAAWAWSLALMIGSSVLRLPAEDGPGGRILSWLVVGIAVQSQIWLLLGFVGKLWPPIVSAKLKLRWPTASAATTRPARPRRQTKANNGMQSSHIAKL